MPIGCAQKARLHLDEKAHQRSNESVADYTTYYRRLVLAIGPGVSEEEHLHRYVVGLQDTIREHVHLREPTTFDEACQLAVRYEAMRKAIHSRSYQARDPKATSGPTPMELGKIQGRGGGNKSAQGVVCYHCSKLGHIAKECRKKNLMQCTIAYLAKGRTRGKERAAKAPLPSKRKSGKRRLQGGRKQSGAGHNVDCPHGHDKGYPC